MADIVTARVPPEIRRQGNEILKQLGSTPTQLVNAAYEYVIAKGELPASRRGLKAVAGDVPGEGPVVQRRVVDADAARELAGSIRASTLYVPEGFWADRSYRDAIAEGRCANYEASA